MMIQENISDILEIQKLCGQISKSEGNASEMKRFFAQNAQYSIYYGDKKFLELTGMKYFESSIKKLSSNVKRSHCLNGQHIIDFVTKGTATGLLFCRLVQVTEESGIEMITEHYIYHEDIYEKQKGIWLIRARDTHFLISDKRALGAQ